MHRNALRDPQIPPDAKTQVQCNVSHRVFLSNPSWFLPSLKNNVLLFHGLDALKCTT
jgi:hypothetical protein